MAESPPMLLSSDGQICEPASNVVALDTRRGPQLSSVSEVRREMAKIYRLTRKGKIRPDVASRLAFILTSILKAVELECIEGRIIEIQRQLKEG